MQDSANVIHERLMLARIPAMPEVLLRLLDVLEQEDVAPRAIIELIATDAALAAKVLACANTAGRMRGRRMATLHDSVISIGLDTVKTLAISEAVRQVFGGFIHLEGIDLRGFWAHSLTTAFLARELAPRMNVSHADEAYLAGLLHDVGKLGLLSVQTARYQPLFVSKRDDEHLVVEELALFGLSHVEVGAWLLRRWALPEVLAEAVLYHHEAPRDAINAHPLVQAVLAADRLSGGRDDDLQQLEPLVPGLDEALVSTLRERAARAVRDTAESLGLALPDPAEAAAAAPPAAVRLQLARRVQDFALQAAGDQTVAGGEDRPSLSDAVAKAAGLLFGARQARLFFVDADGAALVAEPGSADEPLGSIEIARGTSALARAASAGSAVWSGTEAGVAAPIADRQLMRVLDTPQFVCLPLGRASSLLGVLALGLDTAVAQGLRGRGTALGAFAASIARQLDTLDRRHQSATQLARLEQFRDSVRRVAHEANNPLAIVGNYLFVLREKLAHAQPVDTDIQLIAEEIERTARVLAPLNGELPSPLSTASTAANALVREVIDFCQRSRFVPESVQVAFNADERLRDLPIERDALKQVLLNLVKNAAEALPRGGRLDISTQSGLNVDGRAFASITIRDDGPGIPDEMIPRLFSPITSAKGRDHAGLGLSIAHELVRRAGGSIQCRTGASGTVFDVLLPSAP